MKQNFISSLKNLVFLMYSLLIFSYFQILNSFRHLQCKFTKNRSKRNRKIPLSFLAKLAFGAAPFLRHFTRVNFSFKIVLVSRKFDKQIENKERTMNKKDRLEKV